MNFFNPKTHTRYKVAFSVAAISFFLAATSHAQSSDDIAVRTAQRQRQQGNVSLSITTLRTQYGRSGSPRIAAELGRALVGATEWREGEAMLAEALGSSDSWVTRNRVVLERTQRTAQTHLARLELRSNVPSARLVLDEHRLGERALPFELWVEPGTHVIEAAGGGGMTVEQVRIAAGDRASVTLRLLDGVQSGPSSPVSSSPLHSGVSNVGLLFLGVSASVLGAGALATGIAAVALRQDAAHEFNGVCPPIEEARSQACSTILQSERTWGIVRWVTLPLSVAFATTAAVAFWGAGRNRIARATARIPCVLDPGLLSISCTTQF